MTQEQKQLSSREQIEQIVSDGKKGEYWKILKDVVLQWKFEEEKYLDSFKKRGLSDSNMNDYNRSVDRLEYIQRFLNVNESVLSYNNSVMSRLRSLVGKLITRKENFVGNADNNGGKN